MNLTTQPISLGEQLVAVVIADHAVLAADVAAVDVPLVERMCLFAMQITDGDRPGPYRDVDAEREARRALAHLTRSSRPGRRRRGCAPAPGT